MTVFFSSVSNPSAAVLPAVSQAAREFSRFSNTTNLVFTGPTTINVTLQNQPPQNSFATPTKKANPWLMMAALTLLKLPFSFLLASTANKALFGITLAHSFKEELFGIGAEILGTVGIKLVDDRLEGESASRVSHEKQLEIASGVVSFIGTCISTAGCVKDSLREGTFKRILGPVGRSWRIAASLAVGTLCGVVEGFFTAKLEPWLEKQLSNG